MKLACNYSPGLMRLIALGEAPVDYIKAGAFEPLGSKLGEMLALRPVLLHGLGSHERTGMPGYAMRDEDFALLEWALGRAQPDIVTLEYGWPEAEEETLRAQLKRLHGIAAGRK